MCGEIGDGQEGGSKQKYFTLSKVFQASSYQHGTLDEVIDKLLSSKGPLLYLVQLTTGETLQWPFNIMSQSVIPVTYYDSASSNQEALWPFCDGCFQTLLNMPKRDSYSAC